MKKIFITILLMALSQIVSAQPPIEKKCKTCGKILSDCSFHGRHPDSPYIPQKPKPYVERTETKGPNEDYEIKGKYGSSGLALVKLRGKYGFINREGEEIVPLKYDNVYYGVIKSDGWHSSWLLMSVEQNYKWGYINQKGELIIPIIYDAVESIITEKDISIRCRKEGKWGAIGQDGSIHVPFIYDHLRAFGKGHPSRALKDGKYGYIDEYNNIIAPFKYTDGFGYIDSLAWVSESGMYGFIDRNGKEVIPLKYEVVSSFDFIDDKLENAIAAIVVDKKVGFINGKGEEIIACQYENEIWDYSFHKDIEGGFIGPTGVVKKNGKWGVINRKGEVVVPFLYDGCSYRSLHGDNDLTKDKIVYYFDKGGNMYTTHKERNDSSIIRLARQGFPDEQAWIGEYYYRGNNGYPKDYGQALHWFKKSANQDNGHALYFLGWMYEHEQGVEKNYSIAKEYYERCVNISGGYYRKCSLRRLGHIYYYAKGVDKDYDKAFAYFNSAADLGDSEAMYYLGWMYEYGQGVDKKDIEKAKEFYKRSADEGYEEAKKKVSELN